MRTKRTQIFHLFIVYISRYSLKFFHFHIFCRLAHSEFSTLYFSSRSYFYQNLIRIIKIYILINIRKGVGSSSKIYQNRCMHESFFLEATISTRCTFKSYTKFYTFFWIKDSNKNFHAYIHFDKFWSLIQSSIFPK